MQNTKLLKFYITDLQLTIVSPVNEQRNVRIEQITNLQQNTSDFPG